MRSATVTPVAPPWLLRWPAQTVGATASAASPGVEAGAAQRRRSPRSFFAALSRKEARVLSGLPRVAPKAWRDVTLHVTALGAPRSPSSGQSQDTSSGEGRRLRPGHTRRRRRPRVPRASRRTTSPAAGPQPLGPPVGTRLSDTQPLTGRWTRACCRRRGQAVAAWRRRVARCSSLQCWRTPGCSFCTLPWPLEDCIWAQPSLMVSRSPGTFTFGGADHVVAVTTKACSHLA